MFWNISLQTNNHSPNLTIQSWKSFISAVSNTSGMDNLPSESTEFLKQVQSLSVIRYKDNLWEIKIMN